MAQMAQHTELYVWGSCMYGQLGLGDQFEGQNLNLPKSCSYKNVVKKVACGSAHSCFIMSTGLIYGIGSNQYGQLGLQHPHIFTQPKLVDQLHGFFINIKAKQNYTVAQNVQGELYIWGESPMNSLLGVVPRLIKFKDQVQKYSCGDQHLALINQNGDLFMCGLNDRGQLGIPNIDQCAQLMRVKSINNVSSIKCGESHTILLSDGYVYTFGCNKFGQLGIGNRKGGHIINKLELDNISKIQASNFSAAITFNNELYLWGSGIFGEYPTPTLMEFQKQIKSIKMGTGFGCLLTTDGQVYTWGKNSSGELAQKDFAPRTQIQHVTSLKNKVIDKLSCGSNFVICIGEVYQSHDEDDTKQSMAQQNQDYKAKIRYLEDLLKQQEAEIKRAREILQSQSDVQLTMQQDCKSFDLFHIQEQIEQKMLIIQEQQIIIETQETMIQKFKKIQISHKKMEEEVHYLNQVLMEKNKQNEILQKSVQHLEQLNKHYIQMINEEMHHLVKQYLNEQQFKVNESDKSVHYYSQQVRDLQSLLQKRIQEIQNQQ